MNTNPNEKNCTNCKYESENGIDGPCYECIKGIRDYFEPKDSNISNNDEIHVGDEVSLKDIKGVVTRISDRSYHFLCMDGGVEIIPALVPYVSENLRKTGK